MYFDDPLYIEIMRDTSVGDVLTVQGTVARWGRGGAHAKRVLDWMADAQTPNRTMKRTAAGWERI